MYRPLACIMAWAHRKVELSKIVPRGRQNCDGMMQGFRCNIAYAGGVFLGVLANSGRDGPNF